MYLESFGIEWQVSLNVSNIPYLRDIGTPHVHRSNTQEVKTLNVQQQIKKRKHLDTHNETVFRLTKKVRRFCNVGLTWMGLEDFALKEATQRRINSARFYLGEVLKLVSLTGGRAASRGHRGAWAAAAQRLTHFHFYTVHRAPTSTVQHCTLTTC